MTRDASIAATVAPSRGRFDLVGTAAVLLSALGFGTLATLTKLAFDAGVAIPTLLAWRYGLAALLVLAVLPLEYRRRGNLLGTEPWPPSRIAATVLAVLCFVANTTLYLVALRTVSIALAAVLFYLYPVLVVLLRLLGWHERPTLRQGLAIGLGCTGVGIALGWQWTGIELAGALFMLASAALYAAYIVLAYRGFRDASPALATGIIFPLTASVGIVIALAAGFPLLIEPAALPPVLGIAVLATVIPVQLFLYGSLRLGPTPAAILGTFEPIASVFFGIVVYGERLTGAQLLGGLLVVLAAMLVRAERRAR